VSKSALLLLRNERATALEDTSSKRCNIAHGTHSLWVIESIST
jgi:hypothetical protein